mgnify:CR=1 FL=1
MEAFHIPRERYVVSSVIIYVLGFLVVIAGLAMAASLLGLSQQWIIIGIVILVGIMLLSLASRFRNGP